MHSADHYSCLVLTSQRAVDAIRNAFPATLSAGKQTAYLLFVSWLPLQ